MANGKKNGGGQKRRGKNGGNGNGNGNGKRGGRTGRATQVLGTQVAQRNIRPLVERGVTLRGSDFLGQVTAKATFPSASSRILGTFPITPSGYPGTRVTQLAENWERYKFKTFRIRYVPAVPTTVACQFVLYIDTDPNDDPTIIPDGDALIRQAVSQTGSQQWNFSVPANIPLAKRNDGQLYYTGVDLENKRFSRAGTAYLIQVTTPVNFNGEAITSDLNAGSLFIDWECYFETAQINPEAVALRFPATCPPTPFPPLITKDVSFDWINETAEMFKVISTGQVYMCVSYHLVLTPVGTDIIDYEFKIRPFGKPTYNLFDAQVVNANYLKDYTLLTQVTTGITYEHISSGSFAFNGNMVITFIGTDPFDVIKLNPGPTPPVHPPASPAPLVLTPKFLSSVENLAIRDAAFKPNFHDKLDTTLDSTDATTFQIGILNTIKDRKFLGANPDCLFCETCCPQDFE